MLSSHGHGRVWLPLVLVILSLGALLLVPVITGRELTALRQEMSRVLEPAERELHQVHLAILAHPAENAAPLRDRGARSAGVWRTPALERWGGGSVAAAQNWTEFDAALRAWTAIRDRGAGSPDSAMADSVRSARQQVLAALHHVQGNLQQERAEGERALLRAERMEALLRAFLAAVALACTGVVGGFHRRLQAFARQLQRERNEKGALLESTAEGIYGIDADGRCTFINRAGAELLGYRTWELTGTRITDRVHAGPLSVAPSGHRICPVLQTLQTGTAVRVDGAQFRREDGSLFPTQYSASPIVLDGRVSGVVVSFQDISQRAQAEEDRARLLQREQQAREEAVAAEKRARFLADASEVLSDSLDYETTLQSLARLVVPRLADSCVIYLVGEQGEVQRLKPVHADPALQQLLREQLERHPPEMESLIKPVRSALQEGISTVLRDVTQHSLKGIPEDDAHVSVLDRVPLRSLLVVPLRARNRILGAISYGSGDPSQFSSADVQLAEELGSRAALAIDNARLYRASQAAVRAREEVVNIVSHDLRSPLQAVRIGTQALVRHWPPVGSGEVERRQLDAIHQAAEQMSRLVRDLLDIARIEAGRLVVEPMPVEVAPLVAQTTSTLRPLAESEGVQIQEVFPLDLPLLLVDSNRMGQVFSNLISNAIKFSPAGGTISIDAHPEQGMVRFTVADEGCGISRSHMPHLFDRFWRPEEPRRASGTGLGLAIAKGIVEQHGGRIWAENGVRAGARFHFTVPIHEGSAAVPPYGTNQRRVGPLPAPVITGAGRSASPAAMVPAAGWSMPGAEPAPVLSPGKIDSES